MAKRMFWKSILALLQRAKQALCVECGLPETDDLHNAEIQVAATECPLSTVADQMNFHRFVRRSAEATEEDASRRHTGTCHDACKFSSIGCDCKCHTEQAEGEAIARLEAVGEAEMTECERVENTRDG